MDNSALFVFLQSKIVISACKSCKILTTMWYQYLKSISKVLIQVDIFTGLSRFYLWLLLEISWKLVVIHVLQKQYFIKLVPWLPIMLSMKARLQFISFFTISQRLYLESLWWLNQISLIQGQELQVSIFWHWVSNRFPNYWLRALVNTWYDSMNPRDNVIFIFILKQYFQLVLIDLFFSDEEIKIWKSLSHPHKVIQTNNQSLHANIRIIWIWTTLWATEYTPLQRRWVQTDTCLHTCRYTQKKSHSWTPEQELLFHIKLKEILRFVLSWLLCFGGKGKEIRNEGRNSIIGIITVCHQTIGWNFFPRM